MDVKTGPPPREFTYPGIVLGSTGSERTDYDGTTFLFRIFGARAFRAPTWFSCLSTPA